MMYNWCKGCDGCCLVSVPPLVQRRWMCAHISRPEVIISTLCPATVDRRRKWERLLRRKMWRSGLQLSWFTTESEAASLPGEAPRCLFTPIFLPLVHSFRRPGYRNTDDKSIKGCFTFISYFSLSDCFFPSQPIDVIRLHTEGFAYKDTWLFFRGEKSPCAGNSIWQSSASVQQQQQQ